MTDKNIFFSKTGHVLMDLFIFIFSFFAAFFIRFEGFPSGFFLNQMLILFPYIALARFLFFMLFSIYSIAWRYVSIPDALAIFKACLPVSAFLVLARVFGPSQLALVKLPLSVIAVEFFSVLAGTLGLRLVRRLSSEISERERFENDPRGIEQKRTLLIGAGSAGNLVVRELQKRLDLGILPVGFVDDNSLKKNTVIQGVRVLGVTTEIPDLVKKHGIKQVLITIANAPSKEIRRILDICEKVKVKTKIIPGLYEILGEEVKVTKIRDVNIDDLLGRDVISFKNQLPNIAIHYWSKRILITGAGGSIGSELCRQLAKLGSRQLILCDKDEFSIFEIEMELRNKHAGLTLTPMILDVRNRAQLEKMFEKNAPEVIFHAAAHKHVPLMEANVAEAILNNVQGTQNVVQLADRYEAERLIYISSDKAVNPTSVMGATKKVGEIILQEIAARSKTQFSCVRFGNVLGSRGSVVPFFQKQIAMGGPITITDPEVRRYFMSISEAVQLIIQAGTIGTNGEIFVLNMGELIKIVDLAKDLIRLSGYEEGDFEFQYIGLRPGEKLYEEILIDEEKAKVTQFKKIFIAPPIEVNNLEFSQNLDALLGAAKEFDPAKILECLSAMKIGYAWPSRPGS